MFLIFHRRLLLTSDTVLRSFMIENTPMHVCVPKRVDFVQKNNRSHHTGRIFGPSGVQFD